jgi:hypothetical protein
MKEKMKIIVGAGIAILVIFTAALYLIAKDTLSFLDILSEVIILIIIISSIYLVWDRLKNMRAGLPAQDERLKIAAYKAGYYGFIAAIWTSVGTNLGYNIIFDQELRGGLVAAAVVLVSGLVFMFSILYFSRKGDI